MADGNFWRSCRCFSVISFACCYDWQTYSKARPETF